MVESTGVQCVFFYELPKVLMAMGKSSCFSPFLGILCFPVLAACSSQRGMVMCLLWTAWSWFLEGSSAGVWYPW